MRVYVVLAALGCLALLAVMLVRASSHPTTKKNENGVVTSRAVPADRVSVSVSGWDGSELGRILASFAAQYSLPAAMFDLRAEGRDQLITFPSGIRADHLLYLVNYIHYPVGFDVKQRSIAVLGQTILDDSFGVPDTSLIGRNASIYVPADDSTYDLAYIMIDEGSVYEVRFTNLAWRSVQANQLSPKVKALVKMRSGLD